MCDLDIGAKETLGASFILMSVVSKLIPDILEHVTNMFLQLRPCVYFVCTEAGRKAYCLVSHVTSIGAIARPVPRADQ